MTTGVQKWPLIARAVAVAVVAFLVHGAMANPVGMTVQSGQATASQTGPVLNVNVSAKAFLNWQSFNIAAGQTTRFNQPSSTSVVWNRITDPNPSQIFGRLEANGVVVLANQSGFYFGPGSFVKAAGFIATTANFTPEMGLGSAWNFTGMPPLASIINYGQVEVESGGSLFLIAEKIRNNGILSAPDGTLGLYAGKEVLVSERPDGRGLSVKVTLPSGSVDNQGQLIADAGTVALHAQVVNQGGLIQATSARYVNGAVELVASESITLGGNSSINASSSDPDGSGGTISIKSGGVFRDGPGSQVSVAGGSHSGNGGQLEISAPSISRIQSTLDGHAAAGQIGGQLLLDPGNIRISATIDPLPTDVPGTLVVSPSQYSSFSQLTLLATRNITQDTRWTLADSSDPSSLLRLQAGGNILLTPGGSIVAGRNWSVELVAGADITTVNQVLIGNGSITLQGEASISSQNGFVHLYAGKDVLLQPQNNVAPSNGGAVRTLAGGGIDVLALGGNINTGINPNGYSFSSSASTPYVPIVSATGNSLGGISTAAGGDVKLTAGGNVVSYLPVAGRNESDGGSGAFGSQPGNVIINAGGNVTGHFVVANGDGSIHTTGNAGTPTSLLALSLVKGSWDVDAGQDINLQQVRNPNAVYNGRAGNNFHRFDYDGAAIVTLKAGNAVVLSGQNEPTGQDRLALPSIFPPTLDITAGPGGISLTSDVLLYPSPIGQMQLITTGGGALQGTSPAGNSINLVMSDSGGNRYTASTDFGPDDHADTPLHLNDPNPISINVSGNMSGIAITVPKRANVNVSGDVRNSSFTGQNLSDTDVTSITVTGDIFNRSDLTFYQNATQSPDFAVFDRAIPPFGTQPFTWIPSKHEIAFKGRLSSSDLNAYLNFQAQILDAQGNPVVDADGLPVTAPAHFLDPAILQYFYQNTQDVPLSAGGGGLSINGPGKLLVSARNMDLGVTDGIVSHGPERNPALAALGSRGSDITVNLSGNLTMYSSAIASLAGGALTVNAGGAINLGAPDISFDNGLPRGIYTAAKADVSVIAGGNIDLEGSRIASYDGGNILVRSLSGGINAGSGGLGAQTVQRVTVDPVTGQVVTFQDTIPGSGILATSFPEGSANPVGNITVETPRGTINGGAGGIVQLTLNGVKSLSSVVSLNAGSVDANGVVTPGDINLSGSAVIGINIRLNATGNITGNAVASHDINIASRENVSVSAVGGGNVSVSASGAVSGTIVGVGSVSASGANVEANLLSQNVQAGSSTTGQSGFTATAAAGATSQSSTAQAEPTKLLAKVQPADSNSDDSGQLKKKPAPVLVRRVSRVTVILPGK